MPIGLEFDLLPERIDEGSAEERAAFGLFSVRTAAQTLTEGFDSFLNSYRKGPLVSGYHAAEWLAWNWWRLCYEPRTKAADWATAHKMTSIGEGYVWPNLEIWSDGVRTMLISRPSENPEAKPFRYLGAVPTIVPSSLFRSAIDEFMPRVLTRLRDERVPDTNLDRLWHDILAERSDGEVARRRRIEALMGRDPDAVEDDAVEMLIADSARLGEDAVEEIAAEHVGVGENVHVLTASDLDDFARSVGHGASPADAVRLASAERLPLRADVPAWRLGTDAARAVRLQERLGTAPIANGRLAEMAGTSTRAVTHSKGDAAFAFSLKDRVGSRSRIVTSGGRATTRRFALARIIGDQIMHRQGALHPATHAATYRQKAQRSFAAELLAPFDEVRTMLGGDYSEDRQQDIADYFLVSPMVVNTLLKNHGVIERDNTEYEPYVVAA